MAAGRSRALGGVAAQATQAASSFILALIAAHALGAIGLGTFAALYATIVLATALSGGMVGDSLTVLDRHQPPIRAGLVCWSMTCAVVAFATAWLATNALGISSGGGRVAFAAAMALFILEDIFRRLLMANLLFWRITLVDIAALAGSLAMLAVWGFPSLTLTDLFVALAVGQAVGVLAAVALLPPVERRIGAIRKADVRSVAAYGTWRALQQAMRPALLAVIKTVAVAASTAAVAGQLEAARIYTAPALLLIGGVSSALFAGYAADKTTSISVMIRRADRAVIYLVLTIFLFAAACIVALPVLGDLLTGGVYALPLTAVVGWFAFAASVAAVTPYGSLAAVRGRQRDVFIVRLLDSCLAVTAGTVLISNGLVFWVPAALAVTSLAGGCVFRFWILPGCEELTRRGEEADKDEHVRSRPAEPLHHEAEGVAVHDR